MSLLSPKTKKMYVKINAFNLGSGRGVDAVRAGGRDGEEDRQADEGRQWRRQVQRRLLLPVAALASAPAATGILCSCASFWIAP